MTTPLKDDDITERYKTYVRAQILHCERSGADTTYWHKQLADTMKATQFTPTEQT